MAMLESGEMYLETIHILSLSSPNVRSIDIVNYMGYSKPSVSRAVNLLKQQGLIEINREGHISLTASGHALAVKIYERHTLLTDLFIHLGVDEKTAAEDACRIEHYLSDTTFNAIKEHSRKHNT